MTYRAAENNDWSRHQSAGMLTRPKYGENENETNNHDKKNKNENICSA